MSGHDRKETSRKQLSLKQRTARVAEAIRSNATLIAGAAVVAVAAVVTAGLLSWRAVVEITKRATSGEDVAVFLPLAFAIVALMMTQVVWSLTHDTRILGHVKGTEEDAADLRERVERIEAGQENLGIIAQDMRRKLDAATMYEVVADQREVWAGIVISLLADASKLDKEVELRSHIDGAYTAIARVDRIGTYVLKRLSASEGLSSWIVTLYTHGNGSLPFDRLSQEPAVRLVAMIKAVQEIASGKGITIDLSKIKVVLCAGQKPDLASFIAFRKCDDGLYEKVLIEYARPLDPNRARQTADRATIIRATLAIDEREREINERVAKGKFITLADLEDMVRPLLKDILLLDPDNLPGVAFGDHFDLGQPKRLVVDSSPLAPEHQGGFVK